MIDERGKPDDDEIIHLEVYRGAQGGCRSQYETACRTGAYNIRWSTDSEEVTCKRCLATKKAGR